MKFKKILKIVFVGFLLGLLAVYISDKTIRKNTESKLYSSVTNMIE